MRYLVFAVAVVSPAAKLGVESKVSKPPDTQHLYEWRYNPYTGQPLR